MRWIITPGTLLLLAAVVSAAPLARPAAPQKKEYLSETEGEKIRDAGTTGPRIVLYAAFAADRVDIGIEKQQDIRDGVKALQAQIKDALHYLQDLAVKGPERETYKDNLDDAIEATQD